MGPSRLSVTQNDPIFFDKKKLFLDGPSVAQLHFEGWKKVKDTKQWKSFLAVAPPQMARPIYFVKTEMFQFRDWFALLLALQIFVLITWKLGNGLTYYIAPATAGEVLILVARGSVCNKALYVSRITGKTVTQLSSWNIRKSQ